MFVKPSSSQGALSILLSRLSILCFVVLVASCGYKPLSSQSTLGALSAIEVTGTPHASNMRLRLNIRLLPVVSGRYRLKIELREQHIDLGVDAQAQASRITIRLFAKYSLYDKDENTPIYSSVRDVATGYNYRPDAEIANRAATLTANVQNLDYLADIITQDLRAYFADQKASESR